MLQDIRYAARVLTQTKGWTATVVLSLALGIGANTALFSAVNGLLLRKLPVEDPDSLVRLRAVGRNQMANSMSDYGNVTGPNARATFSYPMFEQLRKDNQTMTDVFAGAPIGSLNVVVDGQAEIASAYLASGNYHGLLGVKAVVGRTILPEDDEPGANPVAAISYTFWMPAIRKGSECYRKSRQREQRSGDASEFSPPTSPECKGSSARRRIYRFLSFWTLH